VAGRHGAGREKGGAMSLLKLNFGAGQNTVEGFEPVDKEPAANPKWLVDLEVFPWPWADNSVESAAFIHSLEHMGQSPTVFLGIIKELYRICTNGALIYVNVPHPRHDYFLGDPTHIRPILPATFELFSKKMCLEVQKIKGANSPLALYLGVDFEIVSTNLVLDERFSYLQADQNWDRMVATMCNVVKEIQMTLRVIKEP